MDKHLMKKIVLVILLTYGLVQHSYFLPREYSYHVSSDGPNCGNNPPSRVEVGGRTMASPIESCADPVEHHSCV